MTSNGRQQTVQSVVKRCDATLVSTTSSTRWPQNGQKMISESSIVRNKFAQLRRKATMFSMDDDCARFEKARRSFENILCIPGGQSTTQEIPVVHLFTGAALAGFDWPGLS